MSQTRTKYTPEQAQFLKDRSAEGNATDLRDLFNSHFGLNLAQRQIRAFVDFHKLVVLVGTSSKSTQAQLDFLRTGLASMSSRDLTQAFNENFGLNKTVETIRATLKRHHITIGRKFTQEQTDFLRDNYSDRTAPEITALFNNHFGTCWKIPHVRRFVKHHSGSPGWIGSMGFGRGIGHNCWRPIGSEFISSTGFTMVKIDEASLRSKVTYRVLPKHVHIWEQKHGKVPRRMMIVFKDGDKANCDIDNLMMLSRAEMLRLNQNKYYTMPEELRPSMVALSKLQVKMFERIKKQS